MKPAVTRTLLAACLAIATLATIATIGLQAAQRRNLDFTLVNKTGLIIMEVYLSPTTDAKWGEDVMGADILDDDEKVDITFSSAETECNWDLKIVDEDDDEVVWTKLNLCTASEITLKYENKKPTAIIK
jgi:hypothetical protein